MSETEQTKVEQPVEDKKAEVKIEEQEAKEVAPEHHHEHGPGCDHDHDHAHEHGDDKVFEFILIKSLGRSKEI